MLIGSGRYLVLGKGLGNETASTANSLSRNMRAGVLRNGDGVIHTSLLSLFPTGSNQTLPGTGCLS